MGFGHPLWDGMKPIDVESLEGRGGKRGKAMKAVDFTILWPIASAICHTIPLADYKASD
jgi:hypothetical protein